MGCLARAGSSLTVLNGLWGCPLASKTCAAKVGVASQLDSWWPVLASLYPIFAKPRALVLKSHPFLRLALCSWWGKVYQDRAQEGRTAFRGEPET